MFYRLGNKCCFHNFMIESVTKTPVRSTKNRKDYYY